MKKLPVGEKTIAGLIALSIALFAAGQPVKAQAGLSISSRPTATS